MERHAQNGTCLAQEPFNADGEFLPFAATVDEQGELQYYVADDGSGSLDFRAQIEILKRNLRQVAESGDIRAAGLCFDVLLHGGDGSKKDAIQCSLEHADGEAIDRFTPYKKSDSGAIRYEEGFTTDRDREMFGFAGLILTLESQVPLRAPTPAQCNAAVDSLTPQGGPGFLILEGTTEDYAQAAGGDGRFTAEWREYANGAFKHWVAGHAGESANDATVAIATNGCIVTVRGNEVLQSDDVKSILTAFARGTGKPAQYSWRDSTASFL